VNRELYVSHATEGVEIALLEDRRLVELHQDANEKSFAIGDVILGRTIKTLPGLNAAFIDVGYVKNGFLHYTDLGPQFKNFQKLARLAIDGQLGNDLSNFKFEPVINKYGKINNVVDRRHPILVQILKEPISSKGHRLTCEIAIPGRYLVLMPLLNSVSVSKKITSIEERKRLQRLIESIKPKNFGCIIRTVAEGKTVAELHEDLKQLESKWAEIVKNFNGAKAPFKLLNEVNKTTGMLRDFLNASFNKIVVDSKDIYNDAKTYLSRISPDQEEIVKLYSGKMSLFDEFDITKQIKSAFGKSVKLDNGSELIIEHTEALHVIDINSGHAITTTGDQESNALRVNLDACAEIARQLRLRDLGGIIIIDFIDIRKPEYKRQVFQRMNELMRNDRAKHTILPLSKFNVMQITRQRMKPQITIETAEVCPACDGTGKIGPSLLLTDKIESSLKQISTHKKFKAVTLYTHPYIEAFLKRGILSQRWKWQRQYGVKFHVYSDDSFYLTEFHFYDKDGNEIGLSTNGTAVKEKEVQAAE
jgi:ribonuclease G